MPCVHVASEADKASLRPSVSALLLSRCPFSRLLSATYSTCLCFLLVISLLEIAPKHGADVRSSVPEHRKAAVCLMETARVLNRREGQRGACAPRSGINSTHIQRNGSPSADLRVSRSAECSQSVHSARQTHGEGAKFVGQRRQLTLKKQKTIADAIAVKFMVTLPRVRKTLNSSGLVLAHTFQKVMQPEECEKCRPSGGCGRI